MAYDRFLIAPINTGLETDLKPWLIPDDAFETLFNAYVFRGRVRKRFGSEYMGTGSGAQGQLYSRLGIKVGTTDNTGALAGVVPGDVFAVGQLFAIGTEIFTVTVTGAPGVMLTTGAAATHTYNTSTGAYSFTGAAHLTDVYFYPALPVQGITVFETGPINNQPSFAFDTQFAYTFDAAVTGRWQWSNTGGAPVFTGDNTNFFWAENYRGADPSDDVLFVTNYKFDLTPPGASADHIWSYDGTTWADYSPFTIFLTNGSFVQTARLIIGFKGRLLLLNTVEQAANGATINQYIARCRFSWAGDPFASAAWLQPNNTNAGAVWGGAGFVDASTNEAIIGAEFIKDRLIVFFERSTWELVYTNNQVDPFVWQKINTELGSESTFSTVPFDKVVLAIGNTGVHACNGANVERIDNKIPDEVFEIFDKQQGVSRVWGIRDYFTEMVYWSFPQNVQVTNQPYPARVLVYNYKNNAWAINDDTITAFGYFEQQAPLTWGNWHTTWEESNWTWGSNGPAQNQARQVIAGNQQGFVTLISPDISRNEGTRQISRIVGSTLTIIDHMFQVGQYVALETIGGIATPQLIYEVSAANFTANTITVHPALPAGTYTGGGTAALVSNIAIQSKQWNPYVSQDRNFYLAKIDFAVERTDLGEVTVLVSTNSTSLDLFEAGLPAGSGAAVSTGALETHAYFVLPLVVRPDGEFLQDPYEEKQDRLWHPIYFQSDGQCVQILINMSPAQLLNDEIAWSDFQLEGMALYTVATSSRQQ